MAGCWIALGRARIDGDFHFIQVAVVIVMSQIQPDWWVGDLMLPWMSTAMPFAFGLFA